MHMMMVQLFLAVEGHKDHPEHIKGGHQGRHGGDAPEDRMTAHQGVKQDLVLAEEAGEGEDPGNGQGGQDRRSSR